MSTKSYDKNLIILFVVLVSIGIITAVYISKSNQHIQSTAKFMNSQDQYAASRGATLEITPQSETTRVGDVVHVRVLLHHVLPDEMIITLSYDPSVFAAPQTGQANTSSNLSLSYAIEGIDSINDISSHPVFSHGMIEFQANSNAELQQINSDTWLVFETDLTAIKDQPQTSVYFDTKNLMLAKDGKNVLEKFTDGVYTVLP